MYSTHRTSTQSVFGGGWHPTRMNIYMMYNSAPMLILSLGERRESKSAHLYFIFRVWKRLSITTADHLGLPFNVWKSNSWNNFNRCLPVLRWRAAGRRDLFLSVSLFDEEKIMNGYQLRRQTIADPWRRTAHNVESATYNSREARPQLQWLIGQMF